MIPLKKLMNGQEELAFGELNSLANEYGYSVYVKVRVADVLPIEHSNIRGSDYNFALKSHFDFVGCTKDHTPIFAVEFDGPIHLANEQRTRDAKKNALCRHFKLPLLRINTNHLIKKYNKASLLRWIISAWELQKSFDEAQENGQIPWDEGFDPVMLFHPGTTLEEKHPHWLSLRPRQRMEELHKRRRLPSPISSQFVFRDRSDNYHGIEWIDVSADSVVCVESGMRAQLFPLYLGDLFSELMTVLLFEKLQNFLKSGGGSVEPKVVADKFGALKREYQFASCHSSGSNTLVNVSLSHLDPCWTW